MAASDHNPRSDRLPQGDGDCLTPAALNERLEEEIGRAERHGTGLSCLLVTIDNLDELAREHGRELREQTIDYVAAALRSELRRFDRVGRIAPNGLAGQGGPSAPGGPTQQDWVAPADLVIVLPGADSPRGEIVARRALERVRAIKVEAAGAREALEISVGLAAWQQDVSAEALLARARAALRSVNGEHGYPLPGSAAALAGREPSES
jgi:GGDEF domain-containing protein